MRWIKRIVLLLILIVAGWWLLSRFNALPSFGDLLKPKKVTIDQTPVLLQEIKPLAQLVTLSAYDEIVVDSTMSVSVGERIATLLNPFRFEKVYSEKKLVIIGKAVTHVGIDMEKMTTNQIQVVEDSVHLILPPAEILDVIINPSGTEIFLEQGKWDGAAVQNLKGKIQGIAMEQVRNKGLLNQSEEKARQVLTDFFLAAGFKKVTIEFRDMRLR